MGRDQFKFDKKGLVVKCPKGHKPLDHRILSHNNKKAKSLNCPLPLCSAEAGRRKSSWPEKEGVISKESTIYGRFCQGL